jgi:DNA topoisomerase-2
MASTTKNKQTSAEKHISKKYQKLTDREHVLHNSDTYIGSIEQVQEEQYVMAKSEAESGDICDYDHIVKETITFIPGLYKLFDEAIVNCRDHVVRCQQKINDGDESVRPVSYIKVSFGENDSITVENDGNGIDVVQHPEHQLWVPEMIFGHLRTGTNYDKSEKKIVGGKNGFGVKLIFIWSSYGYVETVDHIRGLKYKQDFTNNLETIGKPKITKVKSNKPYTKITFIPDYKRMNIEGLSSEFKRLLIRRAYDIAAITDKRVKVKVNERQLVVKDFQSYVNCYIGDKQATKRVYESPNERWEYCVSMSKNDCYEQVSFVNGIATYKGGKHVDYITYQLVRKIGEYIKQKKKVDVKPNVIREQLSVFMRCDIVNPAFSSQSKDYLDTPITKFGSSCQVSDAFAEKVAKMGVMDIACSMTEIKEKKANKRTDGVKTSNITGIPKLNDANLAGTKKSSECILILCEGDSAKAGIISGLSTKDRDTIGVYPLRGKLKNIRGVKAKDIGDNAEINDIKKIVGLKANARFTSLEQINKELRYGKIIFMTDQDLDGSHIKGLCINMFDVAWNDLLKHGVIGFMNTPILKATKGSGKNAQSLAFYNDGEYDLWKKQQGAEEVKKWEIKYYKGLGTSTKKEFQEYFKHKKIIFFTHSGEACENSLDMVFNKKKANERKEWLENYDREKYLDTSKMNIHYSEFINGEMIHFSKYDCERSIPNVMDGLKTSQRKIIFSCFLKKLFSKESKVAQLCAYVAEMSCYHHGEQSLAEAIISMAQDFVGSNNVNLLLPNGQFGTRICGGKDAASPRYIFTLLNEITSKIFRQEDNPVLEYLDDDGTPVEPLYYVPIIPMILVNGATGIGTGFSTDVLPHNPKDLIASLREVISTLKNDEQTPYDCGHEDVQIMMPQINTIMEKYKTQFKQSNSDVLPYFKGFTGNVCWLDDETHDRILIKGNYEILSEKELRITELPIGLWTEKYKAHIEKLIEDGKNIKKSVNPAKASKSGTAKKSTKNTKHDLIIKEYLDMSTDSTIDFTIRLSSGNLYDIEKEQGQHKNTNGIHKLFNLSTTSHLTNMNLFNEKEQLRKYEDYYDIVHGYIPTRLRYYILRKNYQQQHLEEELDVISNKVKYIKLTLSGEIDLRRKKKEEITKLLEKHQLQQKEGSYNYLIKMPMDSVSEENVEKLLNLHAIKTRELDEIKKTSIYDLWERELDELSTFLDKNNPLLNVAKSENNISTIQTNSHHQTKDTANKVTKRKIKIKTSKNSS